MVTKPLPDQRGVLEEVKKNRDFDRWLASYVQKRTERGEPRYAVDAERLVRRIKEEVNPRMHEILPG